MLYRQVPYILHFEPSLDALSSRSNVISSIKILSQVVIPPRVQVGNNSWYAVHYNALHRNRNGSEHNGVENSTVDEGGVDRKVSLESQRMCSRIHFLPTKITSQMLSCYS